MRYLKSLMANNEDLQLVTRTHWITLVYALVMNGLALLLLAVVVMYGLGSQESWGDALALVAALLALAPLALLVRDVARWYGRLYVITTRRVLELSGVFNKRMSDSNLDKVNDIVLTQSFLGRFLSYGDIEIITGSDIGADYFKTIVDPVGFKRMILENKEDFDTLTRSINARAVQDDIPAAIARLAELRDSGVVTHDEFERKKADLLARM